MQTGVGLNTDLQRGPIDRFRSLPITRSAVVAGRIVADVVRIGWGALITALAATAFGFRFHANMAGIVAALGVVVAWGFALSWLMAYLGVSPRTAETVRTAGFLAIMPLTFASSVFAPAAGMPGWLQAFVKVNPSRWWPIRCAALTSAAWLAGRPHRGLLGLTVRQYRARA